MMWVILVAALIFGSPGANAQDLTPLHYAANQGAVETADILGRYGGRL